MDALDVEMSIAEGEQALQALLQFAREACRHARGARSGEGHLQAAAAHWVGGDEALLRPARDGRCGTGRHAGRRRVLPREQSAARAGRLLALRQVRGGPHLRPHARGARDLPAGRAGQPPRAVRLVRPAGVDDRVRGRAPLQGAVRAASSQLFDLEVAESVLMEVAQEAPQDYEDFSAQRPVPPEETAGALLVVSVDGKGVPMIKAEAVKLKAKLGTGEKRQQKKEALVGVSDTVDPKPRSPEALAELLVDPEAARARRQREGTRDEAPRAQQVRRVASLVRTKQAVMELIKADAERRDPQHRKPLVVLLDGALGLWHLATTALQALEARDLCAGHHARRRLPLECGQRLVRGSLQGGQALGAAKADGDSPRPGGRRHRRPAPNPDEAAAAEVGAGDTRERHHVLPQPPALDARTTRTWRRACPSGPASWRLANYTTPIQTTASYPMIGVTGLLNLVAVVDKLQSQAVEEKGNLCRPPSSPPASRQPRDHALVGEAPCCESPTPHVAAQPAAGAPADQPSNARGEQS